MQLFFEPSDFLFFRNNKPFTAGEAFKAISRDLPPPSVIYGAVRTWLLEQAGIDWHQFAGYTSVEEGSRRYPVITTTGTSRQAGTLRLRGPYFARLQESGGSSLAQVYYPLPLDLVKFEPRRNLSNYGLLRPADHADHFLSNFPARFLRHLETSDRREQQEETGDYLTLNGMEDYLRGESPSKEAVIEKAQIWQSEQRIGITLSERYVTRPGLMYSLEGQRFQELYGLMIELEGIDESSVTGPVFFPLGGERRFGQLLRASVPAKLAPLPAVSTRFKLTLATSAIFKAGWLPEWLDPLSGEGVLPGGAGLRVRLVAAAVGKPLVLSGFDLALRRPKPIRRAVPAGSVYYFELLEGSTGQLVATIHNRAISDEDSLAGFGVAFVGIW